MHQNCCQCVDKIEWIISKEISPIDISGTQKKHTQTKRERERISHSSRALIHTILKIGNENEFRELVTAFAECVVDVFIPFVSFVRDTNV